MWQCIVVAFNTQECRIEGQELGFHQSFVGASSQTRWNDEKSRFVVQFSRKAMNTFDMTKQFAGIGIVQFHRETHEGAWQ